MFFSERNFKKYFFISRLPFNWKTPLGYLAVLFCESVLAFYTIMFVAAIGCLLIGSCWIVILLIEDITSDLSPLTRDDETSDRTGTNLTVQVYNIVQFHSDVKQLSEIWPHLRNYAQSFENY